VSPAFLALNPLGQIPVLQDGDLTLADSNAILVYLARRYAPDSTWLPREPVAAARVQRWLSIAAGEVMHGPAIARMIALFDFPDDPARAARIAARVLTFMDGHLAERAFLAADHVTIADLACYSYVAHAPDGGVDPGALSGRARLAGAGRGPALVPADARLRGRAREMDPGGPFHRGELIAQTLAGTGTPGMTGIRSFMPDQHRDFFALLPYLFVATVDADGWPVATVLTGEPGFIQSPDPNTLTVAALPRAEEPAPDCSRPVVRSAPWAWTSPPVAATASTA
jgi:glutathione S-transferase